MAIILRDMGEQYNGGTFIWSFSVLCSLWCFNISCRIFFCPNAFGRILMTDFNLSMEFPLSC